MTNGPSSVRFFLNYRAAPTGAVVRGATTAKCSTACCGYCGAEHAGKTCPNASHLIRPATAAISSGSVKERCAWCWKCWPKTFKSAANLT